MNLQTKLEEMVTVNHDTVKAELLAMLQDGKELYNTVQKMPLMITPNDKSFVDMVIRMYQGHGISHILVRDRKL